MKANLIFFLAILIISALFIGHFRLTFSPFSVSFLYWHRTVGVILIVAGCLVYNIGEHISGYKKGLNEGMEIVLKELKKDTMKKIMFNDKYSLTQAVLDGRKTQTRRIIKCPKAYQENPAGCFRITESDDVSPLFEILVYDKDCNNFVPMFIQPKYKVGGVFAIAQCYESLGMNPEIALNDRDGIGFYTKTKFAPGWKNKMFVRADLMPHHIRITNIKIERLQDISDKDCLKEGIYKGQCGSADTHFMDVYYYKGDIQPYCTPREAFAALIDKVSGKGTWASNPYVFVYEFELID